MTRKQFYHITIGLTIPLLIYSCSLDKKNRQIDFEKSIELADYMKSFSIQHLSIQNNDFLQIDSIIVLPDSVELTSVDINENRKVMTKSQWLKYSDLTENNLKTIRSLMTESNNKKIDYDQETFFFMTDSWIDAQTGKAYSTVDISDKEESFRFERVKTIDPIENKPNWFDYYID